MFCYFLLLAIDNLIRMIMYAVTKMLRYHHTISFSFTSYLGLFTVSDITDRMDSHFAANTVT